MPPVVHKPLVTILCGFLGAGKTTLLRHLLSQGEGRRWAAVVNDVAALNIDGPMVAAVAGERTVVELGNGCVCCSSKDELAESIAELAATGKYQHLLVETTGVAEPRALANLFVRKNPFGRTLADFAQLSSLVTVVDSFAFLNEWHTRRKHGREQVSGTDRPIVELMIEQIECTDVVVLNKCDAISSDSAAELIAIISGLNARAEIVSTEHGQVVAELLLDRVRFDEKATLGAANWIHALNALAPGRGDSWIRPMRVASHEQKYGIVHCAYQARRPFSRSALEDLMRSGIPGLLRAKGFFWVAERPDEMGFLSVAGGVVRYDYLGYWWAAMIESGKVGMRDRPPGIVAAWQSPSGDRRQELVFIGVRLNEAELRASLDTCLA